MMTSGVLYRSEVLFYIQNSMSSVPRDVMMSVLVGFYTDDEVAEAKNALFAVASSLEDPPELPRKRTRQGDGRQKADAGDLLNLWVTLDEAKSELPIFVAADIRRIPPATTSEADLCSLSVHVMEIKAQLKEMATSQSKLVDTVAKFNSSSQSGDFPPLAPQCTNSVLNNVQPQSRALTEVPVVHNTEDGSTSTYATAATRPARPTPPVRVKGSGNIAGLKTVPRRAICAAFVGRLSPDTTDVQLGEYLSKADIKGVVCRRLKPKEGKTYKTAAFYVTCCAESRNEFYDEGLWPDGVELRDWVYYNK